jgi:starvation-inducible DNA-binding protein
MPTTRNSIHDNARKAAIAALSARMADAIDLGLAIKQAHWNVRGPQFIAVHEMLDTLRGEMDDHVDTMAERISQLAGSPQGTLQAVGGATSLPPYPLDVKGIEPHLTALADRYGALANAVRKAIDEVGDAGDPTSADVLTQVSRGLDKALWFIEAHLPGNA